jgi:hypothetical protein
MIPARCCATRGHLALSTTATDLQLTPTDVCFSPQTPQPHLAPILLTFLLRSPTLTFASSDALIGIASCPIWRGRLKATLTCGVHLKPSELVGDSVGYYTTMSA